MIPKCMVCGSTDPAVEARGIWYCPNPRCHAPGGGASRHLVSCKKCVTRENGQRLLVVSTCELCPRSKKYGRWEVSRGKQTFIPTREEPEDGRE